MAQINTQVLSGFMELLPEEQIVFNRMLNTIRACYERFGFVPLDTPVIERSEVLFAKAGQETEKQIYRIEKGDTPQALRFDLTVPLARYVTDHMHALTFPFKRYHIAKVYRGERPQKGRFREFYQCDIDIIGAEKLGLINDAEILNVIYTTFEALNIGEVLIRINNRKILSGFFQGMGLTEKVTDILRIIDKLEKIGTEKVLHELVELGIAKDVAENILTVVQLKGDGAFVLSRLRDFDVKDPLLLEGILELDQVVHYVQQLGVPTSSFCVDLSIARGLDYYTGTVYETILKELPHMGSICGGGRYDNLTTSFGKNRLPGVGVSIGLTRLFSQLQAHHMLTMGTKTTAQALMISVGDHINDCLRAATLLRNKHINVQVYLEEAKVKKQLEYAHRLAVPFVILIGDDEAALQTYMLKDMRSGGQSHVSLEELITILTSTRPN